MQRSVYEKIRDGEIDANIVLKDDYITAFKHTTSNFNLQSELFCLK